MTIYSPDENQNNPLVLNGFLFLNSFATKFIIKLRICSNGYRFKIARMFLTDFY